MFNPNAISQGTTHQTVDNSIYNKIIATQNNNSNLKFQPIDEFDEAASQGGDIRFNNMLLTLTYEEFKTQLRDWIAEQNKSQTHLEEEDYEKLSITREQFNILKKEALENREELKQIIEAEKERKADKRIYDTPYRRILNGVFDRLDKTKLTDEEKILFNVQDLPDECYDVFFDKDRNKTTTIYYDFSTKNESFYEFTKLLRSIKKALKLENMNFKCPLMLFDRDLMGLDCQLDTLPVEIAKKVWEEAKVNPFFHFREIAMVMDDKTGERKRFEVNIANWTVIWVYTQCFNLYHEAPRQTGKTFIITHILAYEYAICGYPDKKIIFGHFNVTQAIMNREKMIATANLFPKYLRFHTLKWEENKKRQGWIADSLEAKPKGGKQTINAYLKTVAKAISVGKSIQSAEQAGRGETSPFPYIDELNFITYIQAVMTSLNYTYSTARRKAIAANKRACMLWTSTAGKLNTKHGREMYDLIYNQMLHFRLEFFDLSFERLEETLANGSEKRFFNIKYDYATMGLNNNWFSYMKSLADSPNTFRTEVLQEWLDVDEDALFTQEELSRIQRIAAENEAKAKLAFIFSAKQIEYIPAFSGASFEDTVKTWKTLGIGIDMGHGQRQDYTGMYGIDLETGDPKLLFKDNEIIMLDFTTLCKIFIRKVMEWNPNLKLVVIFEIDGPGQDVLPALIRDPLVEPYLFRRLVALDPKKGDAQIKSYSRKISDDHAIYYGAIPMRSIRPWLTETLLYNLVQNYPHILGLTKVYEEVVSLANIRGKIQAKPGFHDDIIFSALHVAALLFKPEYREALKSYFDFFVDYGKLKTDPIGTRSIYYEEENKYIETEGKIDWEIFNHYDEYNELYQTIKVFKVINGIRTELSENEYVKHFEDTIGLLAAVRSLKKKPLRLNLNTFNNYNGNDLDKYTVNHEPLILDRKEYFDYNQTSYNPREREIQDQIAKANFYTKIRKERLF